MHLFAFISFWGVVLGVGTAYGWQGSVAACGFTLLIAALFVFQRNRKLAGWAIWFAFALSFPLPAVAIMSGGSTAIIGWEAALTVFRAVVVFPFMIDDDFLFGMWLSSLAVVNTILLFTPLLLTTNRYRKLLAGLLCGGTIVAWLVVFLLPPALIGFYLWAASITTFSILKLVDLKRKREPHAT